MQKFTLFLLFYFVGSACFSQSGILDPTFGKKGIAIGNFGFGSNPFHSANDVVISPEGDIYAILSNYDHSFISKRSPDGTIDSGYGTVGFSNPVAFLNPSAAMQPDEKIILAGSNTVGASAETGTFHLARVNTDGTLDASFGVNGLATISLAGGTHVASVAIQNDGKIVVAGTFYDNVGNAFFMLVRENANGTPDASFNGTGIVTAGFGFLTMGCCGLLESNYANSLKIDNAGKLVVGGFILVGGNFTFALMRFNPNGTLDATFNGNGKVYTKSVANTRDEGYSLAIQDDGKILLGGPTEPDYKIIRYNTNGSIDSTFNGDGIMTLPVENLQSNKAIAVRQDKIVVAGNTSTGMNSHDFVVVRLKANGDFDSTFDSDGILTTDISSSDDFVNGVEVQADNKIIVAGYSLISTSQAFVLARYNNNGSLDAAFNNDGKLIGDYFGNTNFYAVSMQKDGKFVATGVTYSGIRDGDVVVARFNGDGSPDLTFGTNGAQITNFSSDQDYDYGLALTIQNDGKIIVAGQTSTQGIVARYNTNGTLDNSFNLNGKLIFQYSPIGSDFRSVALQPDGKIVLTGVGFIGAITTPTILVARLNTDGSFDNSFGVNGVQINSHSTYVYPEGLVIQNDGKIVVGGYGGVDGRQSVAIARYNANGSPDNTFATNGFRVDAFGPDRYFGNSIALQSDGKFVIGGDHQTDDGTEEFMLVRYTTNGILDSTFSGDGYQSTVFGTQGAGATTIDVASDGRIAAGGYNTNFAIALYKPNGDLDSTFGTDGTLGLAVGTGNNELRSLKFYNDKLYAAGFGLVPNKSGIIVAFTISNGGPLPVSLLDFTGSPQNKSVLLNWKIATGKNLNRFNIERSHDGNGFVQINTVSSTGTSVAARYSVVDDRPLAGLNFYRLQLVDADGKFTYSNVIAVRTNAPAIFSIFPNPAAKNLFMQSTGNNEAATFQIFDMSGRKVREVKVTLDGTTYFSINIANLSKGTYNLVVLKNNKIETRQFVKE